MLVYGPTSYHGTTSPSTRGWGGGTAPDSAVCRSRAGGTLVSCPSSSSCSRRLVFPRVHLVTLPRAGVTHRLEIPTHPDRAGGLGFSIPSTRYSGARAHGVLPPPDRRSHLLCRRKAPAIHAGDCLWVGARCSSLFPSWFCATARTSQAPGPEHGSWRSYVREFDAKWATAAEPG